MLCLNSLLFLLVINIAFCRCFLLGQNELTHLLENRHNLYKDNQNLNSHGFHNITNRQMRSVSKYNFPKFIQNEYKILSFNFNDNVSLLPNDKYYIKKVFNVPFKITFHDNGIVKCNTSNVIFLNWAFFSCDKSLRINFNIPLIGSKFFIRTKIYYLEHCLKGCMDSDVFIIESKNEFKIGSIYITSNKIKLYKDYPFNAYFSYYCNARLLHHYNKLLYYFKIRLYDHYSIKLNAITHIYSKIGVSDIVKYNLLVSTIMDNVVESQPLQLLKLKILRKCIESQNKLIPVVYFKDIKSGEVFPKFHSLYHAVGACLSFSQGKVLGDSIRAFNSL